MSGVEFPDHETVEDPRIGDLDHEQAGAQQGDRPHPSGLVGNRSGPGESQVGTPPRKAWPSPTGFGAFGRLTLAGREADIETAADAAIRAVQRLNDQAN